MAEEELVMVVTEGVVALVVTGELVILHMGVEEKLVILSTGEEEEELVILPMGEEEELVISGVTILSSSASVVSSARLAAAQSLSYWAIFSLILVPVTQCVSRSSLRSVTTRPLTWKEPVILPP